MYRPFRKPASVKRPGLTLAEMLVVLGMMAILIALLLPAVQRSHNPPIAPSASNLKEIALAVHSYHNVYNRIP